MYTFLIEGRVCTLGVTVILWDRGRQWINAGEAPIGYGASYKRRLYVIEPPTRGDFKEPPTRGAYRLRSLPEEAPIGYEASHKRRL